MVNLNDSYLNYKIVVKYCGERRATCLNALASAKARAGKTKAVNVVRAIEANEEQKNHGLGYTK